MCVNSEDQVWSSQIIYSSADEIEKTGQTDVNLLDFSKAFDKFPSKRLFLKLDFYGIRDKTNRWTKDFLSKRTQQVEAKGGHFYTGSVASGVPQGSVLLPYVFFIYVNDLGDGIKSRLRLFTDDTIL